jgi:hypothetical protein
MMVMGEEDILAFNPVLKSIKNTIYVRFVIV